MISKISGKVGLTTGLTSQHATISSLNFKGQVGGITLRLGL